MNDNDLDLMLREHGAEWRADNAHRPGIDWAAVTDSKRSPKIWIGLAAVAATAAAVVVPLAVVSNSHSTAKPAPAHRPLPLEVAEQGAPVAFFALAGPDISGQGGATAFVFGPNNYDATQATGQRAVAMGVAANAKTAYSGYQEKGCKTYLEKNVEHPGRKTGVGSATDDVAKISGRIQPSAIAVSADGTRLAFVIDGAGPNCSPVSRLEVYDLTTKTSRSWDISTSRQFQNLAWGPDGTTLDYQLDPQCLSVTETCKYRAEPLTGTYSFDPATDKTLASAQRVIGLLTDRGDDQVPAPEFYWHGQLVLLYNGAARPVTSKGGLGAALATNFPKETVSVAVDPTGDHLIMAAAPISGYGVGAKSYSTSSPYSTDGAIATTRTYRWDRGVVTPVPGNWLLPAW
jgi:hypothetical protein